MKHNVVLIATGSVAIVKTYKIFNSLKNDFNVKVLATPYVKKHFQSKLCFEKENPALLSFPNHIKHAKWADLIVVAPATANTLAKFASGIADNDVMATLLAARCQILFAPAMNSYMYYAIQKRGILDKIASWNHFVIGPNEGKLWEGETGIGRMSEPEEIVSCVRNYFTQPRSKVVIVNNASRVSIDPVRYITSKATGLTGKLLANELRLNGYGVKLIDVGKYRSTELISKIRKLDFDLYISVAAINDFEIKKAPTKIKKQSQITLELTKAVDVVSEISKLNKRIITFKNDDEKQNAITKLITSRSEFIVWTNTATMGSKLASGAIIFSNKNEIAFQNLPKRILVKMIVKAINKFQNPGAAAA